MKQAQKFQKPYVVAVIGPTASGKSELAVHIAKLIGGEIISADSRQVYRGMNIGTGKVPVKNNGSRLLYKGIPHYGIDIASPKRQYSVAQFQKYARNAIADITRRGKIPILCGGTGHWVDSVLYSQSLPKVKPNAILRKQLEKKSVEELFTILKEKDPTRARTIDAKNPRRLIRALEIILTTGKPVPLVTQSSPYICRWIGINPPVELLHKKIEKRLVARMHQGMLREVSRLHQNGVSWKRLESFGLEYKYCAEFLQKKINKEQLHDLLFTAIKQYAKRQMTWFKRNKNIVWIDSAEAFNPDALTSAEQSSTVMLKRRQ